MIKPIVLITSASCHIRKELLTLLNQDGTFKVRACYFSQSKAASLKALGADEVVEFDPNNSATRDAALDDVSAVYLDSLDPVLEGHLAYYKALGNRSGQISADIDSLTGHKPTAYYDYLTTQSACVEAGLDDLWQGNLWKKGKDAMKTATEIRE